MEPQINPISQRSIQSVFVSDLHGRTDRYEKLFDVLSEERPGVVFIGGDFLPSYLLDISRGSNGRRDFIEDYLIPRFEQLQGSTAEQYPKVFLIFGNDDPGAEESKIEAGMVRGLWQYIHNRRYPVLGYSMYGYANVPPTPFRLKDWERYDVSRYVDPGCISPEEGWRTVAVNESEMKYGTIKADLDRLSGKDDLSMGVFLFHAPPYQTLLDRAALDGTMIDHAPLDLHVGSIAIKRFIEDRQPLITLHGHVHESARLSGNWREQIGRTHVFSAAHDGPELAVVRFDLGNPELATRELI